MSFEDGRNKALQEITNKASKVGVNLKNIMSKAQLFAGLPADVKNHPRFQEYVKEAEHQDGNSYWRNFHSSKALADDFRLYVGSSK